MATQTNELQKMLERMRNPGMTRTGTVSSDTRGEQAVSTSRTTQPVMTAGTSSVPSTSQAGYLSSGLTTLAAPQQRSRASTETAANAQIGDALRRSLIERDRMSQEMRRPGMNPVEYRAGLARMAANQNAVNADLGAVQSIREASVADRTAGIQALTGLRDRQMAEAGSFDSSLIGLDETLLSGQFGLAGIEAEGQARDPYAPFVLDLLEQTVTSEDATQQDILNAVNVARGLGAAAPAPTAQASIETPEGLTRPLSNEEALYQQTINMDPRDRAALYALNGYAVGEGGVPVPAQQARAQAQRDQQAQQIQNEAERQASQARVREVERLLRERNVPSMGTGRTPYPSVGGIN